MSRSIEFRGYLNGEVVTGLLLYKGSFYDGWRAFEDGIVFEAPVVQFTGLKDKNGVKIFEGDILECEEKQVIWEIAGEIGVLEWSDDKARFLINFKRAEFKTALLKEDMDILEIIGNIHENPELLEEVK